jgi:RND family efflux transporter MFP subunit
MEPERLKKLKIERKESISYGPAKTPVKRRRQWKHLIAILIVVALALLLNGLYRKGVLTPAVQVQATSVALVYPSQVLTELSASGYVVAQRRASVASKGTGRLVYLGVVEGSRVREGDVIARLDNEDMKAERAQVAAQLNAAKAELGQAEAELTTAERNWERYKYLITERAVSQASHDDAKDRRLKAQAAVIAAKANIKALEASLNRSDVLVEYTLIRAPFDGVILTKNADIGEVVAPFGSAANAKAAVVTMADLTSLMVEADVAEASLPKVKLGQPCEIQLDSLPDERFPGTVDTIIPTADRTRGTVMVKVRFDRLDPRVMPEMSVRVAFLSRPLGEHEDKPLLAVHKDAVVNSKEQAGVFKIENDLARWIPLPEGATFGDYILLSPPFQAGDRIVLKPSGKLTEGARVKVGEQ